MGNRLTKIYTRTGDDGTTGLGDGSRIAKDRLRVHAMGEVDHLNAFIGAVLSLPGVPQNLTGYLSDIQHDLFDLGAELCIPGSQRIGDAHVDRLETQLDELNANLGRLQDFILPGGTPAAAQAHLARTACRNAERTVLTLSREDGAGHGHVQVNAPLRKYLNRLSDFLFVAARELNRAADRNDVVWVQRKGEQ